MEHKRLYEIKIDQLEKEKKNLKVENENLMLQVLELRDDVYDWKQKFKELKDDLGNGFASPKKIIKLAKLADHDGVIHTSWGDLNYTAGNDYIVCLEKIFRAVCCTASGIFSSFKQVLFILHDFKKTGHISGLYESL